MCLFIYLFLFVQVNESGRGAQCNKAIMVVTDGAVETYEDIFARYNWPRMDVSADKYWSLIINSYHPALWYPEHLTTPASVNSRLSVLGGNHISGGEFDAFCVCVWVIFGGGI